MRRKIFIELCPGIPHKAVIVGKSIVPWMVKIIARSHSGEVYRCLANKTDCIDRI